MLLLVVLIASCVHAEDAINLLKTNLQANLPELVIDGVNPTVIPGMYEVVAGRKVFYVDATGRYAILGNLVDLTTKESLTERAVKKLTAVNWNDLPLKIAIRRTIGTGENRIAVFTDPDCPFCQRLEQDTIPKLKNVTVYYFLYPLKIHAASEIDSKKILCAENPDQMYLLWMTAKDPILPKSTSCNNSKNLATMMSVGKNIVDIEATPTIILPSGQVIMGLVPADYLNKLIVDSSKNLPKKVESTVVSKSQNLKPNQ